MEMEVEMEVWGRLKPHLRTATWMEPKVRRDASLRLGEFCESNRRELSEVDTRMHDFDL